MDDVPIPRFKAIVTRQKFTDQAFENTASFATSMLAAPRKKYTPFFALQGCTTVNMEQLSQDLQVATEVSARNDGMGSVVRRSGPNRSSV